LTDDAIFDATDASCAQFFADANDGLPEDDDDDVVVVAAAAVVVGLAAVVVCGGGAELFLLPHPTSARTSTSAKPRVIRLPTARAYGVAKVRAIP
jgi:hypothetical protein